MPLLLPISCAWLVSFWVGLSRLVLFARRGCEGRGRVGGRVGVARAVNVVVCVDWLVWWVFLCFVLSGRDSFIFFFFSKADVSSRCALPGVIVISSSFIENVGDFCFSNYQRRNNNIGKCLSRFLPLPSPQTHSRQQY